MMKVSCGLLCVGLLAAPGLAVDGNYFATGTVRIVSSSHQDTAWMDNPAACRGFRIEHNLLPALEMMRKDPKYTFCMECALHAMELLEAHPELRVEVIQRMREGRLEFGATYNQPYESWFAGEDLVRETYFGRRWILKNLPGCDAKVAFNPDPPARSLQMQQILAKAGIPYLFISRYHEGLYRWLSPDGTGVLAYTPGHYCNHSSCLNGAPDRCLPPIRRKLDSQGSYYAERAIPPSYCLINSQDFSRPTDFNPLISAWNAQTGGVAHMQYSSIRGFFESIDQPAVRFDTLTGERPDVWAYITGPTHHRMSTVKREAARLLPAAEMFTTFACLQKGSFDDWPTRELEQAWKDEIYIDHGIGGKNGHITDEVFYRKVLNARDTGRTLLDRAQKQLAAQVKTEAGKGRPVVVFNDMSWSRSDVVELELPAAEADGLHVVDDAGREVPSQVSLLGIPAEVNVAAAAQGAKAAASSVFSKDYGAENAIDGRWAVCDPNPETGPSDKWNSGSGAGPHELTVDFGQPRAIHKVVIRHEGVIGAFGGETRYNTATYRLQGSVSADGPWKDLVEPVSSNTASLTTHEFAEQTVRYLRLVITQGAQSDAFARIYEIEAYARQPAAVRKLIFVAREVPSLGYRTYYLAPGRAKPAEGRGLENGFYRVALAPGGIASIQDKQLGSELLKTDRFLGGEVFTMLSVAPGNRGAGTDAGEFGAIPQPVMDESFDRVATHRPEWKTIESGAVRTVCELEQPLADATVRQRLVLWHEIKRLDCEVDLLGFNGRLWREFRVAFPLAVAKPTLAYEVPMGVVEIGKGEIPTTGGHAYGGLNYWQACRDIRPRVMQDFVDASDGRGGLALSSSVSVFDWMDPTTNAPTGTMLQPVLLASRKSCNGQGNWYPQTGDHAFRFSLTSGEGEWRNRWRDGQAANHPLRTAYAGNNPAGPLPAAMSFASVDATNLVVSAIKRAEDDGQVVVRCYEMDGSAAKARLRFFRPVRQAHRVNLIELEPAPLAVEEGATVLPVGHHAVETAALQF